QSHMQDDKVSVAFYERQQYALNKMPEELKQLKTLSLPYVSYSLTGIDNLRKLVSNNPFVETEVVSNNTELIQMPKLNDLVDDFTTRNTRVIFTMGKGGVGKTSIASAIAVGLTEKGKKVHLTTTDPAAHLDYIFKDNSKKEKLTISSVDPEKEVEKYKQEVLEQAGKDQDEEGLAYLKEDLQSPCTAEIAVFRAFAEVVEKSENEIVVIDTAPAGHTLLLLDSTEAYHKEMIRSTGDIPESVRKLLPRLRNPEETDVVIVTLAEATPVIEATRLQEDLKRAQIDPKWRAITIGRAS